MVIGNNRTVSAGAVTKIIMIIPRIIAEILSCGRCLIKSSKYIICPNIINLLKRALTYDYNFAVMISISPALIMVQVEINNRCWKSTGLGIRNKHGFMSIIPELESFDGRYWIWWE